MRVLFNSINVFYPPSPPDSLTHLFSGKPLGSIFGWLEYYIIEIMLDYFLVFIFDFFVVACGWRQFYDELQFHFQYTTARRKRTDKRYPLHNLFIVGISFIECKILNELINQFDFKVEYGTEGGHFIYSLHMFFSGIKCEINASLSNSTFPAPLLSVFHPFAH